MTNSVRRYVSTVSHLKLRQIFHRIVRPLTRYLAIRKSLGIEIPSLSAGTVETNSSLSHSASTNPEIIILGVPQSIRFPVDWFPDDKSYLFQFNLHYHAFLTRLSEERARNLIHDWISQNPVGLEPGWHPYPTSLRIINWIRRGVFDGEILESLFRQSEYLCHLTETHLGGNHLLENARALMWAANFFADHERCAKWKERALLIYDQELPEQILADGGHYERSPMYHAIVLEGLLDTIDRLQESDPRRDTYKVVAEKMLDFLASSTHPDGNIALLNDATREVAIPTKELVEYGLQTIGYSPEQRSTFPETGYFVHRDSTIFCCIDGGPIGPDHLPAHAHGDIFSFEISVGGSQLIVDSGVFEYEAGAMREYSRSTRAHNTVTIDDHDQAEFWASFRVARRYRPASISYNINDLGFDFVGTFDGYGHLIGDALRHKRQVTWNKKSREFAVRDHVSGSGNHAITSRIHLHSDVEIHRETGGLVLNRGSIQVEFLTDEPFELEDSWYCPEFGMRLANKAITITKSLETEAVIEYKLIM